MAVLTINDQPVSEALLSVPRTGRAVLSARLASDDDGIRVGLTTNIVFDDGSSRTMTLTRAVLERGAWSVNAVAGANGFAKNLTARAYANVPGATMIRDLLREIGERAGQIDAPEQFETWIRRAGTSLTALELLLASLPGRLWRVQPDGTIDVLRETWPTHPNPLTALSVNTNDGTYSVALEPSLQPGSSVDLLIDGSRLINVRADRVVHSVEPREQRTEIQVPQ